MFGLARPIALMLLAGPAVVIAATGGTTATPTGGTTGRGAGRRDPTSPLRRRIEPLRRLGTRPCRSGRDTPHRAGHGCGETHRGSIVLARPPDGAPIRLTAATGAGDRERRPGVLAFGCTGPSDCAGTVAAQYAFGSCPPPRPIWAVTDAPSFGAVFTREKVSRRAAAAAQRRRSSSPPQWPLATRLIRVARPRVVIWFELARRPMVVARGRGIGLARRYARIARLPFRWTQSQARWPRFKGSASFVVGLPPPSATGAYEGPAGDYGTDVFRLLAGWQSPRG